MISYLNIKKDEYRPTLYGFLYSFLIVSFFILSKSFRDSLFLNNFSKEDLSYLYLVTPIITGFSLNKIKEKEIPLLRRKIGIVFQDFKLLDDRNIFDNLSFVLKSTGWKDKEMISSRINEVLKMVNVVENPKRNLSTNNLNYYFY